MPAVECCQQNASITGFLHWFCKRTESKKQRETTKILIPWFFYVTCFIWDDLSVGKISWESSHMVWPYLRIRCHPCPRCLRWTGQTSADQGWCCAQRVSATEHTSVLRKNTSTANMHNRARACKPLVSAAACFSWFLLVHLFINKYWQNNIIALGIIVLGHQPAL